MKTIYKTTLSIFLFSVLMVFGAKTAMGATSCVHLYSIGGNTYEFSTTYVGDVPEVKNLSCEETPIDFSHSGDYIYLNPNPGFKITSHSPYPGVEREIRIPRRSLPELSSVIINWSGENDLFDNPYTIEYTYKAYDEYGNLLNIDASEIGKATPTSCFGGNFESSTSCSVNPKYRALREGPGIGGELEVLEDDPGQHDDTGDKYEVFSCPSSNYICPGYGQKITSYEQFPDGIREVVFQRIAKPVGVTVYGKNTKTGEVKTESMEVLSAEDGQPNVQIFWTSKNATSCTCTKSNGDGCGRGVSPAPGVNVLASGEGNGDGGNYALTETTTFKVTCDND